MLNKDGKRGLLFILSAPAGTGKTTLVKQLLAEFPSLEESVSCTTREPREGEIDGVDYHFLTVPQFEVRIAHRDFLEHVELYGHRYGTSKEWVESRLQQGQNVILVIDTQGGLRLKGKLPAVFIFLSPPDLEVLSKRLRKRNTEAESEIEQRLLCAKREMNDGKSYDYLIVNDELESAYDALRSIFIAELHRLPNPKPPLEV